MACCSVKLLDRLQVTLDGHSLLGLEPTKVCALLAYLVVESDRAHEREKLAGLLWPEIGEAQARQRLSQTVYLLRQAMGEAGKTAPLSGGASLNAPFILVTPHTLQFNPHSDHWLDVAALERLLDELNSHTHRRLETCEQCAGLLQQASELYRSDFLSDLSLADSAAFEEWALVWREKLHRQMCEALCSLSNCYQAHGELHQGLAMAERWAQLDPLSEAARRQVMRLLALDGQRAQALAHYEAFKHLLLAELAVEPDAETRRLYEHIRSEETEQSTAPGRLPTYLTAFIGREQELVELGAWLRGGELRLITLLGPGGCGKTRLAIQAARALRYEYPDGAFLVSLSGLGSAEAFLPALAHALGVISQPNWGDPFQQLCDYLSQRRLLLILDSFEELLPAAGLVTRILQAAPQVQVLVTSRARLNVQSEQVFPLEGLPYPEQAVPEHSELEQTVAPLEQYAALKLFHATARQARPDYAHTPSDLPYVTHICQLVDGMPLGLILAAGWLSACSPQEIAAEIENSLDFLSSEWSDMPDRQRSLRATLDYSWQLLADDERQAFQSLSVFQSAFTRPAAEQVAGVGMSILRRLVDKSMLQTAGGHYRMHDLVRQYAAEKLSADEPQSVRVQDAHCGFYLARVVEREPRLKSAQRSATLRETDAEVNDVQAAWSWACAQGNLSLLSRSMDGLGWYYTMRVRYPELKTALQRALDVPAVREKASAEAAVLHARLLVWQCCLPFKPEERETVRQLQQETDRLLEQLEGEGLELRSARAMYWKAVGTSLLSDRKEELKCYDRAMALCRELEDTWLLTSTLNWAVVAAAQVGEISLARQYSEQELTLARQVGEPLSMINAMYGQTFVCYQLFQFETIEALAQELTTVIDNLEDPQICAEALLNLGYMLQVCGHYPEAIEAHERALPLLHSLGNRYKAANCYFLLGFATASIGEYARVEAIELAMIQEAEQFCIPRLVGAGSVVAGLAILLQGRTSQAVEYSREGARRYRDLKHVAELGMALGGLVFALEADGQPEAAREALLEALHIPDNANTMITCTGATALLLARRGHLEAALRVNRVALRMRQFRNSRLHAGLIGDELETEWEKLPADRQASIESSISQHNLFSIIREVRPLLEAAS
jgi:predicted ATPase/DNA-binding SARP family transcriptional activator